MACARKTRRTLRTGPRPRGATSAPARHGRTARQSRAAPRHDFLGGAARALSQEETAQLFDRLVAVGDGEVRPADLKEYLADQIAREKAGEGNLVSIEIADDAHKATEEARMRELAEGWDSVRASYSADGDVAVDEADMAHYRTNLGAILRVQARWVGRLARIRSAKKAAGM